MPWNTMAAQLTSSEYIHVYLGHKIGCGGPRTWPTHSPDLTPLENMPHYISHECAAMNPQVNE